MQIRNKPDNQKIVVNSAYSLSAKGIAMIFFLLTDIIIARSCGKLLYGEWCFNYSIVTMCFWIINFGLNASCRVHIAKARVREKDLLEVCKSSLSVRLLVSLTIFGGFLIVLPMFSYFLGYPRKYEYLWGLLVIGSLQSFAYSLVEFCKEVFIGLDRIRGLFVITVVEYIFYFIFGALVFFWTKNIYILALGYFFADFLAAILGLLFMEKYTCLFTKQTNIADSKQTVKELIKYALPLLFINIGSMMLIEMDSVMLGFFYSDGENGIYTIAKSLIQKMTHINFAVSSVVMTEFAVITKENSIYKWKRYKKIKLINILGSSIIVVFALFLGDYLIEILYGTDYIESFEIFRLLLLYYVLYGMGLFSGTLLDYQKKAKQRMVSYFLMIAMNLVLNFILIPIYGGKGAAVATVISMVPYTFATGIMANKLFSRKEFPA